MPKNSKKVDFFVKSNVYTSLESYKVQVLEKTRTISFLGEGWGCSCHGNSPNFVNIIFQLCYIFYYVICHWKDGKIVSC